MMTNCRGNPLWLPILRAAAGGRPYNILFVSGLARLKWKVEATRRVAPTHCNQIFSKPRGGAGMISGSRWNG